jgi:acetate kinase
LGIELEPQANLENRHLISSVNSSVRVCVIPTNEELMIAQHTLEILNM